MRIVVDFRDPGSGAITSWTMVSFTYIVVSRILNTGYTDIWATIASIDNPQHDVPLPIDQVGAAYLNNPTVGNCQTFIDPNMQHDLNAGTCSGAAVNTAGNNGGIHVVHAYVMGFRYNAQMSTTSYLYAGVIPDYPVNPANMQFADATAGGAVGGVTIDYALGAGVPKGPRVAFYNPNLAITFIKVAFVHSRLDFHLTAAGAAPTATYPSGSVMLYSSSYVFTSVSEFNVPVAINRGTWASATEFNQLYYHLPDTRYAIYGITNFDIPQGSGCATIKVNATLDSIDAFTITTPNANPANVFFVADIFTRNIDQLCQPGNNALLASQIFTVGKKSFFTIPTQSLEQFIIEERRSAPVTTPNGIPAGNAFVYQVYAADNTNTDQITYQIETPFNGLTAGSGVKFEFGWFDNQVAIGGVAAGSNFIIDAAYDIKLEVNGFILFH